MPRLPVQSSSPLPDSGVVRLAASRVSAYLNQAIALSEQQVELALVSRCIEAVALLPVRHDHKLRYCTAREFVRPGSATSQIPAGNVRSATRLVSLFQVSHFLQARFLSTGISILAFRMSAVYTWPAWFRPDFPYCIV